LGKSSPQSEIAAERKVMIDRFHNPPLAGQAEVLGIS